MAYDTFNSQLVPIDHIQFSIYGNEDVKRYSALRNDDRGISIAEAHNDMQPTRNGVIDGRLGPAEMGNICETCKLDFVRCPGHMGHTELVEPVYNIAFRNDFKDILSCVCHGCSRILMKRSQEEEVKEILKNKKGKNRLKEMKNIAATVAACSYCGTPRYKIRLDIIRAKASFKVRGEPAVSSGDDGAETKEGEESKSSHGYEITARKCYEIFSHISDSDCKLLGLDERFSRPENVIIKVLPIAPVAIRPSVKADFMGGGNFDDGVTYKYGDIINKNNLIQKIREKDMDNYHPETDLNHILLTYHISTLFNNEDLNLPKSEQKTGGKLFKSISERIKGKPGRIRGNLQGKRVDFSARSVITSDPGIGIDELGVPITIAMNLTFPEVVTSDNITRLSGLVRNGANKYPGANFVFKKARGRTYLQDLQFAKKNLELKLGDVVERHLIDGDYVLFNRQPSLHKLSLMGHRIRVIKDTRYETFRLNVNCTTPYNADFDGDEMNMFVPQSLPTQLELKYITDVRRNIVSPTFTKSVIDLKQDALAGAYLFTLDNVNIDWKFAQNIAMTASTDFFTRIKKGSNVTGRDLYSLILPESLNMKENNFEISNGLITKGNIDKGILNTKLITTLWTKNGNEISTHLINDTQRMIISWFYNQGFSIGYRDCFVNTEAQQKVREIQYGKIVEAQRLITEIENNPDIITPDTFEQNLTEELSTTLGMVSKTIVENMNNTNSFYVLYKSGSKGKPNNIAQIVGGQGQMIFMGGRIPKRLNNRTLPHFMQYDDGAIARGFAHHSFTDGLQPHEMFYSSAAGREGLIDVALKTADTGYIARKLIKGLEDLKLTYDGTVRDGKNTIIQFTYADSNYSQVRQLRQKSNIIEMSNSDLKQKYTFTEDEMKQYRVDSKMNTNLFNQLRDMRDFLRRVSIVTDRNYKTLNTDYFIPVDLKGYINDSMLRFAPSTKTDLTVEYIIEQINWILHPKNTYLKYMKFKDIGKSNIINKDDEYVKTMFKIFLYDYLSPKRCLVEYKFSKKQFDELVQTIIHDFKLCMTEPGEMVGIVAAHGISEQNTQANLNTKHSTGIAKKGGGGALGIGRMKEILAMTKSPKTPVMNVYLTGQAQKDKNKGRGLASYIKQTMLREIVDSADIMYDPTPTQENSQHIKDKMTTNGFPLGARSANLDLTPWVIRLHINRDKLVEKELNMLDIKTKIVASWAKYLRDTKKDIFNNITHGVVYSTLDNSPTPTVHIRLGMNEVSLDALIQIQEIVITQFQLQGLKDIVDAIVGLDEICLNFNNENQEKVVDKENVIFTAGVNITDIRFVKGVDLQRTICNDLYQIYINFGIEAVRAAILKEIRLVFNDGGSDCNYSHLSILVDLMTNNGLLTSIDRFGVNRLDTDPLSRASFEKTMEQLVKAAMFAEKDQLRSVSSRIMLGKVFNGGTGLCKVFLDTEMIENSEQTETENRNQVDLFGSNEFMDDILNKTDVSQLNVYMPE